MKTNWIDANFGNSLMNWHSRSGRRKGREIDFCQLEHFVDFIEICFCIVCSTKAVFTCYAVLYIGYSSLTFSVCILYKYSIYPTYLDAIQFPCFEIFNVKCQSTFNWLNIIASIYRYGFMFVYHVTMYKLCSLIHFHPTQQKPHLSNC